MSPPIAELAHNAEHLLAEGPEYEVTALANNLCRLPAFWYHLGYRDESLGVIGGLQEPVRDILRSKILEVPNLLWGAYNATCSRVQEGIEVVSTIPFLQYLPGSNVDWWLLLAVVVGLAQFGMYYGLLQANKDKRLHYLMPLLFCFITLIPYSLSVEFLTVWLGTFCPPVGLAVIGINGFLNWVQLMWIASYLLFPVFIIGLTYQYFQWQEEQKKESAIEHQDNWWLRMVLILVVWYASGYVPIGIIILAAYLAIRYVYVMCRGIIDTVESTKIDNEGNRVRIGYVQRYRGITGWSWLDHWVNPVCGLGYGNVPTKDELLKKEKEQFDARLAAEILKADRLVGKARDDAMRSILREHEKTNELIKRDRDHASEILKQKVDQAFEAGERVGTQANIRNVQDEVRFEMEKYKQVQRVAQVAKANLERKLRDSGSPADLKKVKMLEDDAFIEDLTATAVKQMEEEQGALTYKELAEIREELRADLMKDLQALNARDKGAEPVQQDVQPEAPGKGKEKVDKRPSQRGSKPENAEDFPTEYDTPFDEPPRTTVLDVHATPVMDAHTALNVETYLTYQHTTFPKWLQFIITKFHQSPKEGNPFFDATSTKGLVYLWKPNGRFAGTGFLIENSVCTIDHNVAKLLDQGEKIYGSQAYRNDASMPMAELKFVRRARRIYQMQVPQGWDLSFQYRWKVQPTDHGSPTGGPCMIVGIPDTNPLGREGGIVASTSMWFRREMEDPTRAYAEYSSEHGMSGSPVLVPTQTGGAMTYGRDVSFVHENGGTPFNEMYAITKDDLDVLRNVKIVPVTQPPQEYVAPQQEAPRTSTFSFNTRVTPEMPSKNKGGRGTMKNMARTATKTATTKNIPGMRRTKFWAKTMDGWVDYGEAHDSFEEVYGRQMGNWSAEEAARNFRIFIEEEFGYDPTDSHSYPDFDENPEFWEEREDRYSTEQREEEQRARVAAPKWEQKDVTPQGPRANYEENMQFVADQLKKQLATAQEKPVDKTTFQRKPTTAERKEAKNIAAIAEEVFHERGDRKKPPPQNPESWGKLKMPNSVWQALSKGARSAFLNATPQRRQELITAMKNKAESSIGLVPKLASREKEEQLLEEAISHLDGGSSTLGQGQEKGSPSRGDAN